VRRLPREGLARRQAHAVLDALARARGERPDPRRWRSPPPRHEAVLVLPVATASTEPLLFGLSRLVAGLVAWLAGMHAGIDRFTLELMHVDRRVTRLEIVAGAPSRDAARLILLARERLAMLELVSPVETLHLAADTPVAQAGRTPDLFGDPGQTRENAALLLARLRARLGEHAVRRIVPWPDHRPECASRMLPVDAPERAAAIVAVARPAWLLERPRPLDAPDALERVVGPERIEAGWWDGADVRRDYFVVRTRNAALWWVFHDRADGGWYVHGYFG
jgi:protein ImuB